MRSLWLFTTNSSSRLHAAKFVRHPDQRLLYIYSVIHRLTRCLGFCSEFCSSRWRTLSIYLKGLERKWQRALDRLSITLLRQLLFQTASNSDIQVITPPTMNSPGHTPNEIQSHLYLSFLHGHTADVALHAKGQSWEAIYQLHRVVLIQAVSNMLSSTARFPMNW